MDEYRKQRGRGGREAGKGEGDASSPDSGPSPPNQSMMNFLLSNGTKGTPFARASLRYSPTPAARVCQTTTRIERGIREGCVEGVTLV